MPRIRHYVPARGILFQAALEADPSLIEFGAENKVILSTPSTLIALLKAVAYGWKQEQLADNAKKISEAGADLYNTCSILSGHFSSLGKSLNQAVAQYNKTVSSFEHRFIPRAQKLKIWASPPRRSFPAPWKTLPNRPNLRMFRILRPERAATIRLFPFLPISEPGKYSSKASPANAFLRLKASWKCRGIQPPTALHFPEFSTIPMRGNGKRQAAFLMQPGR